MSWAALDDRLHSHPKVVKLMRMGAPGLEAFGVWTWFLSWCRAYSPDDGKIDLEVAADYWGFNHDRMADLFARLVKVGLVDQLVDEDFGVEPQGHSIHDWHDWQFTNQQRGGQMRAANAKRDKGRFAKADET